MLINRMSLLVLFLAVLALASGPLYEGVSFRGLLPDRYRDAEQIRVDAPVTAALVGGETAHFVLLSRGEHSYLVDLESDDFDPVLRVQTIEDGAAQLLGTDDDGGPGNSARFPFCAPASGPPVVLTVRSFGSERGGSFTLRLRDEGVEGCRETDDPRSLLPAEYEDIPELPTDGVPVSGSLTSQSSVRYLLRTRPAHRYVIDLESTAFDAYLNLHRSSRAALAQIASNDDGGDGRDARLTYCTPAGWYPHVVEVRSFGNSGSGRYRLRAREAGTCDD